MISQDYKPRSASTSHSATIIMDKKEKTISETQGLHDPDIRRHKAVASCLSIQYREPLPSENNEEFKDFVFGAQNRKIPIYEPEDHECVVFPQKDDQISRDTSASYGEGGATASVNAYAMLMQITRYLGAGRSGFFTLEMRSTPEPCMVQERARRLMELGQDDDGIGIIFEHASDDLRDLWSGPWKLSFIHGRWPRYTRLHGDLSITSQHYVSNGTVFVRTHLRTNTASPRAVPMFSGLKFRPDDYQVRELDFLDHYNAFNHSSSQHSHALGPNGCSVILVNNGFRSGHSGKTSDEYHNAVCLIFAISVNGEVREFEKSEDRLGPCYRLKNRQGDDFTLTHPLEIVEAYKLQLVPKKADWKDCVISHANFPRWEESLRNEVFRKFQFATDSHLDFIIRRNLEHILSVCSIPIPLTQMKSKDEKLSQQGNQVEHGRERSSKEVAIALTCGDLSGHRLVTSASYFAYQFLLAMFRYLKGYHSPPCECDKIKGQPCEVGGLCKRIEDTCKAHLDWIIRAKFADGCFKTQYWATGEEALSDDRDGALHLTTLTDTPFQILKLSDFVATFDQDHAFIQKYLHPYVRPWVRHLDQKNKRGFFAFSRTTGMPHEGYQNYRLEDHVWIWSALQVVEQLGLGGELKKRNNTTRAERKLSTSRVNDESLEQNTVSWDYSPAEFRRAVLGRFTAQNPVSKQRMLAVARSLLENRFLLRARDTTLFYDTKTAIFERSDDLWQATIEAQKFHKENEDASWDNPLRYALALLMANKGHRINSKSLQEIWEMAKNILFQSSSASGMLPGQLNMETKEPEIFLDGYRADFYWHTSFEVLYILWQVRSTLELGVQIPPHKDVHDTVERQLTVPGRQKESISRHRHLEMQKSMLSNNLIDQQSIVEILDEWLYNLPNFINFEPDIKGRKELFEISSGGETSLKIPLELFYDLEPRSQLRNATFSFMEASNSEPNILKGAIIDVAKSKPTAGREKRAEDEDPWDTVPILTSYEMYDKLKRLRTAEEAEKRLIWASKADPDIALLCLLSSPDSTSESPSMAAFFDRHFHREKYFVDETEAALNVWKTEFHLSSYQLVKENDLITDLKFLGGKKWIRRAGTGFRIVGDFLDRHWTCHVLEYEPKDGIRDQPNANDYEKYRDKLKKLIKNRIPAMEAEKQPWRQRKVLELILFDRMLEKIIGRYKEMLSEADDYLRSILSFESKGGTSDILSISNAILSSEMDSYSYLEFRKHWPPFQYTLQVMEEDLKETLDTISLWRTRENDRELERPRWTQYHERRYRSVITKITTANNHKIRDLERYHSKIQSFRDSFASRLESTRNDLSFQSAENVRYFTYVTVVFLPLGFGASTMSTTQLLSGEMALNMFVAVVIIGIPTALALIYGPMVFEKVLRPIFKAITCQYPLPRSHNGGRTTSVQSEGESSSISSPQSTAASAQGAMQWNPPPDDKKAPPGGKPHDHKSLVKVARELLGKVSKRPTEDYNKNNDRQLEAGKLNILEEPYLGNQKLP